MTANRMQSSNQNGHQNAHSNTKNKAPLELNVEFLSAVMKGDYNKAHILCRRILDIEPDNNLCKEFHEVLNEVINKNEKDTDEKGESSDGDDSLSNDSTSTDSSGGSAHENGVSSSSDSISENSDCSSDSEDIPIEELKNMSLYVGGLPANIRKER